VGIHLLSVQHEETVGCEWHLNRVPPVIFYTLPLMTAFSIRTKEVATQALCLWDDLFLHIIFKCSDCDLLLFLPEDRHRAF